MLRHPFSLYVSCFISNTISRTITEPVAQIEEALIHLSGYAQEFSSVKESFILILKNFNHTLSEIQTASASVASDAAQIAGASQTLSEGAGEQAGAVEELTATIETVSNLAAESAKATQRAYEQVSTRELIHRTLQEIEKGNAIALSTSESFEQIILDMKSFAGLARQTTENANEQAEALLQVEQGIEQISGAIQSTAVASEENTAVSVNLSEKSVLLDELLRKFVINKKFHNA